MFPSLLNFELRLVVQYFGSQLRLCNFSSNIREAQSKVEHDATCAQFVQCFVIGHFLLQSYSTHSTLSEPIMWTRHHVAPDCSLPSGSGSGKWKPASSFHQSQLPICDSPSPISPSKKWRSDQIRPSPESPRSTWNIFLPSLQDRPALIGGTIRPRSPQSDFSRLLHRRPNYPIHAHAHAIPTPAAASR